MCKLCVRTGQGAEGWWRWRSPETAFDWQACHRKKRTRAASSCSSGSLPGDRSSCSHVQVGKCTQLWVPWAPPCCREVPPERLDGLIERHVASVRALEPPDEVRPNLGRLHFHCCATSHVTPSRAAAREVATGRPPPTRTTPLRPLALSFPSH